MNFHNFGFLPQTAIWILIKLSGNVSIESQTRLLTGSELIADIDNNKRILNSANNESLVEVLLENNENN